MTGVTVRDPVCGAHAWGPASTTVVRAKKSGHIVPTSPIRHIHCTLVSVKHVARVSLQLFGTFLVVGVLALVTTLSAVPSPGTATTSQTPQTPQTPESLGAPEGSETAEVAQVDGADLSLAAAARPLRVALFMPFDDGGRTGLILPRNHTPALLNGFSWDLHKGPGAAVRANMSSPDGTVALKVARIQSNSNGAGQRVLLDVRVNGTLVGQVQFGHLTRLQVSTSTPSFAPGRIIGYLPSGTRPYSGCADRTSDGWPYSSSWRVCTPGGIHTHTDVQRSCWASLPTYTVQSATTPIAMMSSALPIGHNAQCNAAELREVATQPVRDGDFVTGAGNTWRMAGGAPIWVSAWEPFGGRQPYTALSDARFAALAQYPADGTWLRGLPSGRLFRVAGGAALVATGLTPSGPVVEVDDVAIDQVSTAAPRNRLRLRPADGTFVHGARSNRMYVMAGGAPLYISSLRPWGGVAGITYVSVADAAFDNAGGSGVWARLSRYPAEGTFLIGKSSGGVFRVAGGSPQWVDSWTPFGGRKSTVPVDDAAIERAGSGGDWNHLRAYPVDGTVLRDATGKRLYRVAGGAPIHLRSTSVLEAGAPAPVDVSATVIDNAQRTDRNHSHLRPVPADGSFVIEPAGAVYVFAGGAPLWVHSWAPYGGRQPAVRVDAQAIAQRGTTAQPWGAHVAASPANTTFLRVLDTGTHYRVAGGALVRLSSCTALAGCAGAVGVTSGGVNQYKAAHPVPANGTVLRFLPSGTVYRIDGGRCQAQSSTSGAVTVNDGDHPCHLQAPGAPARPGAVAADRSASVTWTAPSSDGGRPITGYTVIARAAGQADVQVSATAAARRAVVSGLRNGVAYTFEVRATNAVGTGTSSPRTSPVVPAGAPQAVAVTGASVSGSDVNVTWSSAAANGAAVQTYVVTATGPAGTRSVTVAGSLTRATVAALPSGTYAVSVVAVNAAGRSVAGTARSVTVSVAVPGVVPNVRASVSGTSVGVTWTVAAANGAAITRYRIEVGGRVVEVGAGARSATVTSIPRGTHQVRVSAVNAAGNGPVATSSVTLP